MEIFWAFLVLAGRMGGFQADPSDKGRGLEGVLTEDRVERWGEVLRIDPAGILEFRDRERGETIRLAPEVIRRIRFGTEDSRTEDPEAEVVFLIHGGRLSGRLRSFDSAGAVVETPAGTMRVRREAIRWILLGGASGPEPERKSGAEDVLVGVRRKAGTGGGGVEEVVSLSGELLFIGPLEVLFRTGGTEERLDRTAVKKIFLRPPSGGVADPPSGWFVRAFLRNGDRLPGILGSAGPDHVVLFSHLVGEVRIPKREVRFLRFGRHARASSDHLLVCDQMGVREFDTEGGEIWTFSKGLQFPGSAFRLESGNVLVADMSQNRVVVIEPSGKNGGRVVWKLEGLNSPVEATPLRNGHLLVVEQQAGRVVEYDPGTKAEVWTWGGRPLPLCAQRLASGHTLVSSYQGIEEVNPQGRVVWSIPRDRWGLGRALRLEGGNTLIVDLEGNRVVEIDPQLREVWKASGFQRLVQAVRLEDGNTLLLEQGAGRLVEIDPSGRLVERIRGLSAPRYLSVD